MRIVMNICKKPFLRLLLLLILLEILIFVIFLVLNISQKENIQSHLSDILKNTSIELKTSYESLINKNINKRNINLLKLKSFLSIKYKKNENSKFSNVFEYKNNNFVSNNSSLEDYFFLWFNQNKTDSFEKLILKETEKMTEEEIITKYINNTYTILDKIILLVKSKKDVFYLDIIIRFIKSNYIKNLIEYVNKKISTLDKYIIIYNDNVFLYPIDDYNISSLSSFINYNKTNCTKLNEIEKECFNIKFEENHTHYLTVSNENISNFFLRSCMKYSLIDNSYVDICIYYSIILPNLNFDYSSIVNIYLVKYEQDENIKSLYFDKIDSLMDIINIYANHNDYLKEYRIPSFVHSNSTDNSFIHLFHLLYFDIFYHFPHIDFKEKDIYSQYRFITDKIKSMINNNFNKTELIKLYSINYLSNFNSYELLPYIQETEYYLQVTPIINYGINLNSSKVYIVLLTKTANGETYKNMLISLIFKCTRLTFTSIGLNFLILTSIFLLSIYYFKFLLLPLLVFKKSLEELIRERNDVGKGDILEKRRISNDGSLNSSFEYKNKETKKLEEMIMFLKRILIMKNTSGSINYKERSKIYEKFLKFLNIKEDKKYYKRCHFLIAYSKFKDGDYDSSLEYFIKILEELQKDEEVYIKKNESLDHIILTANTYISSLQIPYYNEFMSENLFPNTENNITNNYLKLKITKQKTLYYCGLMKYLTLQEYSNEDNSPLKEELINSSIEYLKLALEINIQIGINHIKSLFIRILIIKLEIYRGDISEANNLSKELVIKYIHFNNIFFNNQISYYVDSVLMLFINSVLFEEILDVICNLAIKNNKIKLSFQIYNLLLENNFYININLKRNIFQYFSDHLFSSFIFNSFIQKVDIKAVNFHIKNQLLSQKITNRDAGVNKFISIVVSDGLLLNHMTTGNELKDVLLRKINKYVSLCDLISYSHYGNDLRLIFPPQTKEVNYKIFSKSDTFFSLGQGLTEGKGNIYNCFMGSFEVFKNNQKFEFDKYLFIFTTVEEFTFESVTQTKTILTKSIDLNLTVIIFLFSINTSEEVEKTKKISIFSKNFVEGYVVNVKSFEVFDDIFQWVSYGIPKNNFKNFISNTKSFNEKLIC